jgi:hypothetical protein
MIRRLANSMYVENIFSKSKGFVCLWPFVVVFPVKMDGTLDGLLNMSYTWALFVELRQ